MEMSSGGSDTQSTTLDRGNSSNGGEGSSSRRYGLQFLPSSFLQTPISAILEYSGILRPQSGYSETEGLISGAEVSSGMRDRFVSQPDGGIASGPGGGEVAIRIIGSSEPDSLRGGVDPPQRIETDPERENSTFENESQADRVTSESERQRGNIRSETTEALDGGLLIGGRSVSSGSSPRASDESGAGVGGHNRDSGYQRYDIQQAARWLEQILPFSLLLLVVFVRQHLQGFFVTIWIAAVLFKSNDILKKQTSLKGERKPLVLIGISLIFTLHVAGIYWWCQNDGVIYPLIMRPPKVIPPFWHAIFIILVNDTMVRQTAMIFKCWLLIFYKNGRGRNYRRQGQMLTMVEYLVLLYRTMLPAPVWYRFFLNKEYGSLFSSLTTGLYLTFKLTSAIEKVQSFLTALKALSHSEIHYGSHATTEQVAAVGDLCAICQEKMHAPVLLRCKHIFCEDCVSEWFERERTCPLCRALVKPVELRSFGDGSTSLFFQLF
ncbi:uncharacterized protein LOC144714183 [Wolffia australiana]